MSHEQAAGFPFLVHLRTSFRPGAHLDFTKLIRKSAAALEKADLRFGIYETIVGDVNVVHRFAPVKDLNALGGVEVLLAAVTKDQGENAARAHFSEYQDLVQDEVMSLLRYEPELSVHAAGDDLPPFMLHMRTQVRPGTQHEARALIGKSVAAFRSRGNNGVAFVTASTIFGEVNVIHRLTPLKSIQGIGGIEVLSQAHGDAAPAHLAAYKNVVADEEISLLRRI